MTEPNPRTGESGEQPMTWFCHECRSNFRGNPPCPSCGSEFCEMGVNAEDIMAEEEEYGVPPNLAQLQTGFPGTWAGTIPPEQIPDFGARMGQMQQEHARYHDQAHQQNLNAPHQQQQYNEGQQQQPGNDQYSPIYSTINTIFQNLFGANLHPADAQSSQEGRRDENAQQSRPPSAGQPSGFTWSFQIGGPNGGTHWSSSSFGRPQSTDSGSGASEGPPSLRTFLEEAFGRGNAFGPFPPDGQEGPGGQNSRPGQSQQDTAQAFMNMMTQMLVPPNANPGDYAWGERGLDDIISQMMNQQQSANAPPPASDEAIAKLAKVRADDEIIAKGWDCTVCKENFNKGEKLIKLPCTHFLYDLSSCLKCTEWSSHDDCIVPWLKVNGTCAICRAPVTLDSNSNPQTGRTQPSAEDLPQEELD